MVDWTSRTIDTCEQALFFLVGIFSVQRGTPRESDTASRREKACLLNPCNVVAQLVHHSLHCGLDTDMLLTHKRFGPKSDSE